jgi:hypothetical protein
MHVHFQFDLEAVRNSKNAAMKEWQATLNRNMKQICH